MTDKTDPRDEKAERLAAALRANLRRRKAAARKPAASPPAPKHAPPDEKA